MIMLSFCFVCTLVPSLPHTCIYTQLSTVSSEAEQQRLDLQGRLAEADAKLAHSQSTAQKEVRMCLVMYSKLY